MPKLLEARLPRHSMPCLWGFHACLIHRISLVKSQTACILVRTKAVRFELGDRREKLSSEKGESN